MASVLQPLAILTLEGERPPTSSPVVNRVAAQSCRSASPQCYAMATVESLLFTRRLFGHGGGSTHAGLPCRFLHGSRVCRRAGSVLRAYALYSTLVTEDLRR